jgi:hypothetical protein
MRHVQRKQVQTSELRVSKRTTKSVCGTWERDGAGFWCLTSFSTIFTVISWWSVLLVEETRVPGENHRPAARHWQTLSHNGVSSTSRHERDSNSQR